MSVEELTITRLGQRGEGIAQGRTGIVYVPYALADETVLADVDGDLGHIVELRQGRPDRIEPICPYFGACGGCSVQTLPRVPYAAWKRDLVCDALRRLPPVEVLPLVDAHGAGRRRATFHARLQPTPNVLAERRLRVGFMRARSHEVIDIEACPILSPSMAGALPVARALAKVLAGLGKPVDMVVTATDAGLDVDLRGSGPLDTGSRERLARQAVAFDVARVANHGDVIIENRPPTLQMGAAQVLLPPGAFLQATVAGEEALGARVVAGVGSARKVADLFCGLGTFALRMAERATVTAVDLEGPALAALARAAGGSSSLRPVTTVSRDLFLRPLPVPDLARFDAVVFDPPRAGAEAQAGALAQSAVPTVVAVSCNPGTFARDAAILIGGGYQLASVTPVDQFRYSAHVELVAVFRRERQRRARPLFG